MLSLADCREILNEGSNKYTDNEVKELRDLLYQLANIECKQIQLLKNEKSNNLHKSINR